MFIRNSTAVLWFAATLFAAPAIATEPAKKGRIDAETIAAFEKLGATYGGFIVNQDGNLQLGNLKDLTTLCLTNTAVTDAGLKEIKNLKNLTTLNRNGAIVKDEGLKELKDLKYLTSLFIGYPCHITDAGTKELQGLKSLSTLDLTNTSITSSAEMPDPIFAVMQIKQKEKERRRS
jgi:hypothetical protein